MTHKGVLINTDAMMDGEHRHGGQAVYDGNGA